MFNFRKKDSERAIYFHEDDYCQVEIVPLSNWDFCVGEINKMNDFADAHEAKIGWTDIYLRKQEPQTISDFSISVNDFKKRVEKTLAPFSKVTTGYSSHIENSKNTLAWGLNEREFTIFANYTRENLISALWLDVGVLKAENLAVVTETFDNLPNKNEFDRRLELESDCKNRRRDELEKLPAGTFRINLKIFKRLFNLRRLRQTEIFEAVHILRAERSKILNRKLFRFPTFGKRKFQLDFVQIIVREYL